MSEPTDQERWQQLQIRVKEAHFALEASKDGDLPFPHAMRVMATFGPYLDVEAFMRNDFSKAALVGWQRRSWNGILCAEKVLPFWTEAGLVESNVLKELEKAREVVKRASPTAKKQVFELSPSYLTVESEFSPTSSPELQRALWAYLTAEFAVQFTYTDVESPFELDIDYEDPEVHNYEPQRNPCMFYASIAVGGYIGGYQDWTCSYEDKKAKRKFWLWWLNEAVPASWDLKDI